MTDLEKYLNNIADDIAELFLSDDPYEAVGSWLEEEVLNIDYIVDSRGYYRGAELLVTVGGPNVFVSTKECMLKGYWGFESKVRYLHASDMIRMDEILSEYWRAIR